MRSLSFYIVFSSIFVFCLAIPVVSRAASFDCAKATTNIEKAICGSPELSSLDDKLASVYAQKKAQLSEKNLNEFVVEQREWVRERNIKCSGLIDEKSCLLSVYNNRILFIQEYDAKKSFVNNTDLNRVHVLYSEDDNICYPLGDLYDKLSHDPLPKITGQHQLNGAPIGSGLAGNSDKGNLREDAADWEERHAADFARIGLVEPKFQDRSGDNEGLFSRLYEVDIGGGDVRKVLISDYNVTKSSFGTDVFLFKKKIPGLSDENYDIDAVVMFGKILLNKKGTYSSDGYDFFVTKPPYPFSKSDIYKKYSRFSVSDDAGSQKNILNVPIGINSNRVKQRLFLHNGSAFFTAREVSSYLVYSLKSDGRIEDVCYFASGVIDAPH